MRFLRSSRVRWWIIVGLWLALSALAVWGFLRQSDALDLGRSVRDALYLTVQLPTAQYNGGPDAINWQLEVARFGMPILTAGTLVQTASLVFADQFRRYRLRFASGHTIVCGLGDSGTRLALAFADAGENVVAIEQDAGAPGVAQAKERHIAVLIGEGADRKLLTVARVDRAARLIAVSGEDATNVQIALAATDLVGDRPGTALRCAVRLADASLTTLLRTADLDAQGSVRVAFFNMHERAARALLAEHPPFSTRDGAPPHLAVIGLGQLGRSLVVALAQQWVETGADEPLHISLVDRIASGRWESLCLQHPALAEVVTPHLIDLDLAEPTASGIAAIRESFARMRPTWIAVTTAEEALALTSALLVHQSLAPAGTTIVVRTRTRAWLDALLNPRTGIAAPFPGLRLFPFLDRTCTREAIDGGVREQLAQAMHQAYLANETVDDGTASVLRRPWEELDDEQRDPSRRRVDGIIAALDTIDCELAPLRRWGAPETTLTDDEIERLAAFEHQRWFDDRVAAGWEHGETRDDERKRNPLLLPWEEVPQQVRDMNIRTAVALPAMLARAGFEPVRRGGGLISLEL